MDALGSPLPSSTATVYSTADGVRKEHPAPSSRAEGLALEALTKLLLSHSVPTAPLLSWEARPKLITLWEELPADGAVDWRKAGEVVRKVHGLPLEPFQELGLPQLATEAYFDSIFLSAPKPTQQAKTLISMLESCVKPILEELEEEPLVVVHDDLWPKNFLSSAGEVFLVDWDNTALAPAAHDLSFLVRAHAAGELSEEQLRAFEQGYGSALPPLEQARKWGTLHRARWVVSLFVRCSLQEPKGRALLWEEAPLWSHGTSPA